MSTDADGLEPVENGWDAETARQQWRREYDLLTMLKNALRDAPEMPHPRVLNFLGRAAKYPEDFNRGKREQRRLGLDAIPPRHEPEGGAGVWVRIRAGLLDNAATAEKLAAEAIKTAGAIAADAADHPGKVAALEKRIADLEAELAAIREQGKDV